METCWIHVDWFFTDRYDYDYWLKHRHGGCNSAYYIEATRCQFDTIRSFKPHATNSRTMNQALIETLKNLFNEYELIKKEKESEN